MRLASIVRPSWPRAKNFLRGTFRWTRRALAVYGLLVLVYTFGFEVVRYQKNPIGKPLAGTNLQDGDLVLTERISFGLQEPKRFDVVLALREDGSECVFRVFALPGEKVTSFDRKHLAIDGQQLELPAHLAGMTVLGYGNLADRKTVACNGGYYLLGDLHGEYNDSRFEGPFPRDQILGRSWLILWPWRRFGFVNP